MFSTSISGFPIAFIDTEVGVDSQRVWDYGAVREDGAVLHTQSAQEFCESQYFSNELIKEWEKFCT